MTISSPKDFFGKKVLILGLGLHGGGVSAAYWFFRQGAEVIVTDTKSRQELEPSVLKLTALCNEYRLAHSKKRLYSPEYVFGKHRGEDVVRSDIVIQNPGVPSDSMFLTIAREYGIPIHNDASIFFTLARTSPTIGVTGTRGKTTTVLMIAAIVRRAFPRTVVAGIAMPTGAVSLFSVIDRVCDDAAKGVFAPAVLELSSWQLEVLGSHGLSPRCAVVTTITPDHLNRYASMEKYIEAKRTIVRFQSAGDTVVLNADDPVVRSFASDSGVRDRCYWFSLDKRQQDRGCWLEKQKGARASSMIWYNGTERVTLCDAESFALPGAHNRANALAATTVGMIHSVPRAAVCAALSSFSGVPGRLERGETHAGRTFYNDTTATSPDATRAALATLGGRSKKIILIAGGADKKLVFDELGAAIARSVKALVLLSGTASPHIVSAAAAAGYAGSVDKAHSMREAVQKAWKHSRRHDIILLSPAAASFGLFQHEFDRGSQFFAAIKEMKKVIRNF